MIIIDGSEGEGGGQVLRNACALALVTGQPFRIANIRGKREKPGLMRQRLTAIEAACRIGGAECEGLALGSTELKFRGRHITSASVLLTRSRFEGTAFLAQDVASTTAHEMGHALGIVDHSPHPGDKMWVSGNFGVHNEGRDPEQLITPRDVNTLEEAYCRP